MLERIRGLLGGRAAEEIVFGDVTTGAENDLDRATVLARQMVCLNGMSEVVGLTHCAQRPAQYLVGPEINWQRDCSEQTAREIDEEVKKLLDRAYAEAKKTLTAHREKLELVSGELLQRETLDAQAFYRLIGKTIPARHERANAWFHLLFPLAGSPPIQPVIHMRNSGHPGPWRNPSKLDPHRSEQFITR